jgi:N-acetylmuramoyl-L-alanine amidase
MRENTSIVVCGRRFDIGTRVVLWDEHGGFNAYSTAPYSVTQHDRRTGKDVKVVLASGKRYGARTAILQPGFEKLQVIVKQFFLHHSGLYHSRDTFHVLHNTRRLSVHVILDDDGTLYQTLDLREKAWHGGVNNSVSVGIEIDSRADARKMPYAYDEAHRRKYRVGPRKVVPDVINGHRFLGFAYSDAQYAALIKLARTMLNVFPRINARFPTDSDDKIIKATLSRPTDHEGFICHYHNTTSKWDPVSFDYERFLNGVRGSAGFPEQEKPPAHALSTWRDCQQALALLGYDSGPIDGLPGVRTMAAMKHFQADAGLTADGVWGPKTTAAVEEALEKQTG